MFVYAQWSGAASAHKQQERVRTLDAVWESYISFSHVPGPSPPPHRHSSHTLSTATSAAQREVPGAGSRAPDAASVAMRRTIAAALRGSRVRTTGRA